MGQLVKDDTFDGSPITSIQSIAYQHAFTYDILPDSDTGFCLASCVAIGSALKAAGP